MTPSAVNPFFRSRLSGTTTSLNSAQSLRSPPVVYVLADPISRHAAGARTRRSRSCGQPRRRASAGTRLVDVAHRLPRGTDRPVSEPWSDPMTDPAAARCTTDAHPPARRRAIRSAGHQNITGLTHEASSYQRPESPTRAGGPGDRFTHQLPRRSHLPHEPPLTRPIHLNAPTTRRVDCRIHPRIRGWMPESTYADERTAGVDSRIHRAGLVITDHCRPQVPEVVAPVLVENPLAWVTCAG